MAIVLRQPEGRSVERRQEARKGASLEKAGLAADRQHGELVAALDGNWAEAEKAIGDKIKRQGAGDAASSSPPPMCCRRRAIRSMR